MKGTGIYGSTKTIQESRGYMYPVPFYIYPLLSCIVLILPYIPVPFYTTLYSLVSSLYSHISPYPSTYTPLVLCIVFVRPYIPVPFYIYPLLSCIVFLLPYIPVPFYIYPLLSCIVFVLPYVPVPFYRDIQPLSLVLSLICTPIS